MIAAPGFTQVDSTSAQSAGTPLYTQAIVDQHLQPTASFIGKLISTLRFGGAKHLNHASQRFI